MLVELSADAGKLVPRLDARGGVQQRRRVLLEDGVCLLVPDAEPAPARDRAFVIEVVLVWEGRGILGEHTEDKGDTYVLDCFALSVSIYI